jgi:cobalt-zinc-cadmium efflux system protein
MSRTPAANRAFAFGVVLNAAFVVAEFVAGTLADSVALIADAAHNLGDVAGLLLAWGAAVLATRAPTERRTYGWRKSTIVAALANALLLFAATGALAWEAIGRFADPPQPQGMTMIVVAGIGVVVNALSAWMLLRSGREPHHHHGHGHDHDHQHHHDDINLRAAFQHLAADAAVSFGVVAAGIALVATDWRWLDPLTSLVIAVVIVVGTWSLLRESLALTLDAVPAHIEIDAVRRFLCERPGVVGVHDLHVWALGSSEVALTVHLVLDGPNSEFLVETESELRDRFGIDHSTLQIEPIDQSTCRHANVCRV